MKKFSVNLLKVGLLLILGLCVFSVGNEARGAVHLTNTNSYNKILELDEEYSFDYINFKFSGYEKFYTTIRKYEFFDVYNDNKLLADNKTDSGHKNVDYITYEDCGTTRVDRSLDSSSDNRKYTDGLSFKISKPGKYKVRVYLGTANKSGKWNAEFHQAHDIIVYVEEKDTELAGALQREEVFFINKLSNDVQGFSKDIYGDMTEEPIYIGKNSDKTADEKYFVLRKCTDHGLTINKLSNGLQLAANSKTKRNEPDTWYYIWSPKEKGGKDQWLQIAIVEYEIAFFKNDKKTLADNEKNEAGNIVYNLNKDETYYIKFRQKDTKGNYTSWIDIGMFNYASSKYDWGGYTNNCYMTDNSTCYWGQLKGKAETFDGKGQTANRADRYSQLCKGINGDKVYEFTHKDSMFTTGKEDASFKFGVDIIRQYRGGKTGPVRNFSWIWVCAEVEIGDGTVGKDIDPDNDVFYEDNGGDPPPANEQPFEAGQKIKYSVAMNVRDNIRGKEIGELPANVVVEFIEFKDSYLKVKVKNPEGTIEERFVFYGTNNGVDYKATVSTTSGEIGKYEYIVTSGNPETDLPPIGETDLKLDGFMGIISRIIEMLMKFITEINWAEVITTGTSFVGEIFSAITGS